MLHTVKYCFLLLAVAAFAGCKQPAELPSLKETYSKKDKNPFGGFVFFNQVQLLFNQNSLNTKTVNFATFLHENEDTNALFISVSKSLFLSKADVRSMLQFVADGNSIFIGSQHIDSTLLDSLGCKVVVASPLVETLESIGLTSIFMDSSLFKTAGRYSYRYVPFASKFSTIDTSTTRVLGYNNSGNNYVEIYYGRGKFYLHCEPRALSNYFLLQNKNYKYLQNVFALIDQRPDHLYWDDFYNKRTHAPTGKEGKGGVAMLLQYPSMAWAFWLAVVLLVLYIIFGGKRRQRIIQTIPKNVNSTLAFTETIGNLYLQKKDNRNIADKMILYFYEHFRKQYFLNANQVNADFIDALSRKSNVSLQATQSLFNLIEIVKQKEQISDEELLLLNNKIDNFYLNKI